MPVFRLPPPQEAIAFGRVVRLADAHVAEGGKPVELVGDAETRHPAFLEVVEYLLCRNLPVIVPTDGSLDDDTLARLESLRSELIRFVVDAGSVPDPDRRLAFLRRRKEHCDLRLEAEWTADGVVRVVEAADLAEMRIYIGAAPPTAEVARLARALHARRIVLALGPDAGLDRFSDTELGTLYRCGAVLPR